MPLPSLLACLFFFCQQRKHGPVDTVYWNRGKPGKDQALVGGCVSPPRSTRLSGVLAGDPTVKCLTVSAEKRDCDAKLENAVL